MSLPFVVRSEYFCSIQQVTVLLNGGFHLGTATLLLCLKPSLSELLSGIRSLHIINRRASFTAASLVPPSVKKYFLKKEFQNIVKLVSELSSERTRK